MINTKNVSNDNNNSDEKEKDKENVYINEKDSNRIFNKFEEPMVSLFENCFSKEPTKEIKLTKFLFTHKLTTDKYKEQIEVYRRCNDEKLKKKIKQSLKCITPSGTFTQRQESSLITHTKLICIDIDFKDNYKIDLNKAKHIIGQHCPSLYYAGLSLGGKGIFLIFRISNPEFHKQHFDALEYYLNKKFGLIADMAVKSPVSLRVVSYDENPYYNPQPVPFQHIMETKDKSAHVVRTAAEKDEIRKNVERAVNIIWKNKIDITNQYKDWFKIGCALAHEFGEEGRMLFHRVSWMYEKYEESGCDIQYNKCLKYKREIDAVSNDTRPWVKIATFFYYCRKYGIRY
jgi:hypothetical protein